MNGIDKKEHMARGRTRFGSRASAKLAGALAAAALAVPAGASGYAVSGDVSGSGHTATPPTAAGLVLHRDGSQAVPFVAEVGARDTAGGGFDWGDALIGAGAALGIAAIGGAGLTMRRRGTLDPGSVLSGS
jgi:hypothetical protein